MQNQLSIFIAAPTGFLIGLLLSMPVGPVNLTIINGAAQRGFKYAMLIGLGAVTMDVIYCTIAFTGFSSFFGDRMVRTSMEVFTFVFMLFLGMKFLSAKTVTAPTQLGAAASRIEKRIDEKLHPHSAYMIGFTRVLGNMGVLLFWIVAAAYFMSHEAYSLPTSGSRTRSRPRRRSLSVWRLARTLWFCALSYIVSRRGYGRFNEHTLVRMQHFSGFACSPLGLYDGGHIAWQLAHLARHRI